MGVRSYEPDEFLITGEDGKVGGLRSGTVKLDGHLGHKVTVSGLITPESKAGETKKGTERAPGDEESGRSARCELEDGQRDLRQVAIQHFVIQGRSVSCYELRIC